jgi:SAM-dependent methyltransferase
MAGGHVLEIVFVHVRVHPHALEVKLFVILRAGERREDEELQHVDRQLALDDFDVALDGLWRVGEKSENVPAIGDDAGLAPNVDIWLPDWHKLRVMQRSYPITAAFLLVLSLVVFPSTAGSGEAIPFVPSPMIVVDRMLQLAEVRKDDVIYDLGCGDGRILIQAAKRYGARGVGVDMNATLVEEARRKAKEEGVSHLVEFRAGDGLQVDISPATVVTLYMYKWFNNEMRPKLQRLKPGSRVVAHDYDIDDWKPTKVETVDASADPSSSEYHGTRTLYLWKVEARPAAP